VCRIRLVAFGAGELMIYAALLEVFLE